VGTGSPRESAREQEASRRLADRIVPPGATAAYLAPLPAAALRLAPETVTLLGRLGLKTIGDLAALPRQSLERRFNSREVGAAVLTRLDQALGLRDEPARGLVPPARYLVRQAFAEPLVSSQGVMTALADLGEQLAADLAKTRAGARRLVLGLYRCDGSLVRIPAGLSRPSREAAHFRRLLADKLAAVDLGFGVDLMTLAAPATEPLAAEQTPFADLALEHFPTKWLPGSSKKMRQSKGLERASDSAGTETALAAVGGAALLIDRLASRLGPDKVLRLAACASHLPEAAERLVSALAEAPAPSLDPPPKRGARPPFLLPHPEPVTVVAEVPDGPPASLEWRRRRCRIVKAEGPERIAPEWWQPLITLTRPGESPAESSPRRRPRTRDYYAIEDEAGRRYWVFREGLWGREEGEAPPAWYLHGLFA
jgi:protein ImuB